MSALYASVLVLHVTIAIFGLGAIAALAVALPAVRAAEVPAPAASTWVRPLLQFSALGLGLMLVTGLLLDPLSGGLFHGFWWFRLSILLLALTGALHAQARRASRQTPDPASLRRIQWLALWMFFLIAAAGALMEVKPF